jgi:hypothetical protein
MEVRQMELNREQRRAMTKQMPREQKQSMTKEALREHLEAMFPAEQKLISRRDYFLNGIVAWGTLANADSEGNGIKERILLGNKTFYERNATIDWLLARAKA